MSILSPSFRSEEFACRCGCGLDNIHPDLVIALQELRDHLGVAIHVVSGCRCAEHNERVNGEDDSYHIPDQGCKAADIVTRKHTPSELKKEALKIPAFLNGGIGLYPSFLHVDVRKFKARW